MVDFAPELGTHRDGQVFTLDGWIDAEVYAARSREATKESDDAVMWSMGGLIFAPALIVGLVKHSRAKSMGRPLGVKVSNIPVWDVLLWVVLVIGVFVLLVAPSNQQQGVVSTQVWPTAEVPHQTTPAGSDTTRPLGTDKVDEAFNALSPAQAQALCAGYRVNPSGVAAAEAEAVGSTRLDAAAYLNWVCPQ